MEGGFGGCFWGNPKGEKPAEDVVRWLKFEATTPHKSPGADIGPTRSDYYSGFLFIGG